LSLLHPGHEDATADGFVLAGGQSSRMGHDKALIRLAGTPLIQYAINTLRTIGLQPRIAGAQSDLSPFAPIVPDDPSQSGLGPLSGICSALAAGSSRYAVFLPIDLPLLPSSLIACLLQHTAITQSAVTVISIAGFVQTFPVVVDRDALPVLQSSLLSNDRNCLRAFRAASNALSKPFGILPVELLLQPGQISHPQGLAATLWFLNINFPHDLAHAESLFAGHLQVS
jgi:molybdopterin-guanine dinucleotide biosynthesis protein A